MLVRKKNRQIGQWTRTESRSTLIELKQTDLRQRSKDKVFSTNGTGTTRHLHANNNNNLDTDLTLFTKISKKWIRPKCETQDSEIPRRQHRRKPR